MYLQTSSSYSRFCFIVISVLFKIQALNEVQKHAGKQKCTAIRGNTSHTILWPRCGFHGSHSPAHPLDAQLY